MEFSKPPGSAFAAAPRRAFTAPIRPASPQPAPPSQSTEGLVDTLYDHPSVKIVAFTAGSRPFQISSRASLAPYDVEPGSLPYSSQIERTIAVGPFRIYRAPGSVAFLSCGSALQPILPKSQVWCVDEASSKFVLQIRRPQYWRIEVPVADSEDVRRALLLREVLDKVLQFEKTECPFKRSFTVELPERPQTPIKKRPWTPVRRASLPPSPVTPVALGNIKKRASRNVTAGSEQQAGTVNRTEGSTESAESSQPPAEDGATSDENGAAIDNQDLEAFPAHVPTDTLAPSKSRRPGFHRRNRSCTAPPHLNIITSILREESSESLPAEPSGSQSPTGSHDSFHSTKSWGSTHLLPPSPPPSDPSSPCPPSADGAESVNNHEDTAAASDLAGASNTSQAWSASSPAGSAAPSETGSSATAPSSVHDMDQEESAVKDKLWQEREPQDAARPASPVVKEEVNEEPPLRSSSSSTSLYKSPVSRSSSVISTSSKHEHQEEEPTRPQIRRRGTTSSSISPSRRGALSPGPSAADLFTSFPHHPNNLLASSQLSAGPLQQRRNSAMGVISHLPMTVIHKTCEILMSPPSHLLNLMLNVAARISAGQWRGFVFGTGESGERIPVHWDWTSEDDDEDDLMRNGRQRDKRTRKEMGTTATNTSARRWSVDHGSPSSSSRRGRMVSAIGLPEKMRMKMAGSFPESESEEEEDEDEDSSNGNDGVLFKEPSWGENGPKTDVEGGRIESSVAPIGGPGGGVD